MTFAHPYHNLLEMFGLLDHRKRPRAMSARRPRDSASEGVSFKHRSFDCLTAAFQPFDRIEWASNATSLGRYYETVGLRTNKFHKALECYTSALAYVFISPPFLVLIYIRSTGLGPCGTHRSISRECDWWKGYYLFRNNGLGIVWTLTKMYRAAVGLFASKVVRNCSAGSVCMFIGRRLTQSLVVFQINTGCH